MALKLQAHQYIVKRIAKEAIAVCIGLMLLLGVYLWISGAAEDSVREAGQVKTQVNQKTAEVQLHQTKIAQFGSILPLWNSFKEKDGSKKFSLSRDDATSVFVALRDLYLLKDIRVTVSPVRPSADASFTKTNARVVESDISVSMRAYTDEDVIKFLQSMDQRLAGVVKVKHIRIFRNASLPIQQPTASPQGIPPPPLHEPQVDVIIQLLWYGIEDLSTRGAATPSEGSSAPAEAGGTP